MAAERAQHWSGVYSEKAPDAVSWYQAEPSLSLSLIEAALPDHGGALIDVGGGASLLVDRLVDAGYADVSVLDIAPEALARSRARLGDRAGQVTWLAADITNWQPPKRYALWHDRACFHFLTDEADRTRYLAALKTALAPGGTSIIAAFAPDGPEKCSGLAIRQYDADRMLATLGPDFILTDERREAHLTPWGAVQRFAYFVLEYRP